MAKVGTGNMWESASLGDNIDQFLRNHNDLFDGRVLKEALHIGVRFCQGFNLSIVGGSRHLNFPSHFTVHLNHDLKCFATQRGFVDRRPRALRKVIAGESAPEVFT